MDKSYQAPRGQLLPTLVIFAFVIGLLYTLFLVFQQMNLNRQLSKIEGEKVEIEQKMEQLQADQIEEIAAAQDLSDALQTNDVKWSQVVSKFQKLVPVSVFFSSYSLSGDGAITVSGLGDDYEAVADVIKLLIASPDFDDVFVPSVTQGSTGDGQEVVSFGLTVHVKNE